MTNRRSKKVAFVVGTLTGVMATYFLMSEEGQKWKAETSKRVRQFSGRISDQAQDQFDYIAQSMDIFIDQFMMTEEVQLLEEKDQTATAIPQIASDFKRGMKSDVKYFQTSKGE